MTQTLFYTYLCFRLRSLCFSGLRSGRSSRLLDDRALTGDGTGRTLLGTDTAVLTVLVHHCKIIHDMDAIERTVTLAHTAGDTSGRAGILDCLALQMVLAGNIMLLLIRNEIDDVLRAGLHAGTTGHTLLLIDDSDTVYDVDCIECTGLHAGTVTTAAECTFLLGTVWYDRKIGTVCDTGIVVCLLRLRAVTLAAYERDHLAGLVDRLRLDTHHLSDLLSDRSTADRTLGDGSFTVCDGLRTAITARESAGTAVVTWQTVSDLRFTLIYFNLKLLGSHAQEDADD